MRGPELVDALPDLARLRIEVFAEWPYLYDGDLQYEAHYLREFSTAPDAILVVASDQGRIVGASTASPMWAQKTEFRRPFDDRGLNTSRIFYFGESVLYPEYRGQGIGHAFFDHREAQARSCNAQTAIFAGVIRPEDHPSRPPGYVPLDDFWRRRGYAPVEGLVTHLAWRERGAEDATNKPMQYWRKDL
jgi:GNAT superfamily N-acetyltransferase